MNVKKMVLLVWISNSDGTQEYFNQRWQDYTFNALNQPPDVDWGLPVHPADRERSRALWQHSLQAGEPYRKLELQYTRGTNLVELVKRVVEQHRLSKPDRPLVIQVKEPLLPATYDEARLEQVLDNLIN